MATDEEKKLASEFVKASGYKLNDIAALNVDRRTVVTKNGGKYAVSNKGRVRHLLGPQTPKDEGIQPESVEEEAEKRAEEERSADRTATSKPPADHDNVEDADVPSAAKRAAADKK